MSDNNKWMFVCLLVALYHVSACLPFGYYKRSVEFKNCTGDTLIIGHSYFDAMIVCIVRYCLLMIYLVSRNWIPLMFQ